MPLSKRPDAPRCKATSQSTGERCWNPPMNGTTVCRMHGGSAPQVRKKAAERLREAASDAAAYLVRWMSDESVDMSIRVRVAQDILDRAGVSKSATVTVGATPRFEALFTNDGGGVLVDVDVVDAEVVEDTTSQDLARYDEERARAQTRTQRRGGAL